MKQVQYGSDNQTKLFGSHTEKYQIFPYNGGLPAALAARVFCVSCCCLVSACSVQASKAEDRDRLRSTGRGATTTEVI